MKIASKAQVFDCLKIAITGLRSEAALFRCVHTLRDRAWM